MTLDSTLTLGQVLIGLGAALYVSLIVTAFFKWESRKEKRS